MKRTCDRCQTDYSIDDAREAGANEVFCNICQAPLIAEDPSLGAAVQTAPSGSDDLENAGGELAAASSSPASSRAAALPMVPRPPASPRPPSADPAVAKEAAARPADSVTSEVAPARQDGRKWLIYLLGGHALAVLVLGGALAFLLTRRPSSPQGTRTPAEDTIKRAAPPVDARPVVPEGALQAPAQVANAPEAAVPPSTRAPKTPRAGKMPKRSANGAGSTALSLQQKELAALYGGSAEQVEPAKLPSVQKTEHKHEQVSDAAIMATVTRNKKSVQACYERVLKHDESMRNLRVDVQLKVGVSGKVTSVRFGDGAITDSDLGRCLSQTLRRWHFPAMENEYQTAFPLLLQAQ